MYQLSSENFETLLTYSDFYGCDCNLSEFYQSLSKVNLHKAISITCELIAYRNKKINYTIFNSLLSIPMECGLKIKLLDLNVSNYAKDPRINRHKHIVSLQMLLLFLKHLIVYGDPKTLNDRNYDISFDDYKEIIDLQLQMISLYDSFFENMNEQEQAHFVYANYHINYEKCVANSVIRNYYMFETLAGDPENFDEEIRGEWRDYINDFANKYGFSIMEYIAIMFYELIPFYNDSTSLAYTSVWRNVETIYSKTKLHQQSKKIINLLSSSIEKLYDWANSSLQQPWDFRSFYSFPFIKAGNEHIAVSDLTSRNALSENLYWLIRGCYEEGDSRCMAFYGRLHEKYVQVLTENALSTNTTLDYIEEFACKSGNKSSDAYIKNGTDLIIVECKGFSVLADTISKGEKIEANYEKLFVKPILQADKRFNEIVENDGLFTDITQTYIISVTMDNVNAVPAYYKEIYKVIDSKKESPLTKYVYNLNVEEYEQLMYYAENNFDIISILKDYFESQTLLPFTMYLSKRFTESKDLKTKFMNSEYSDFRNKVKEMFVCDT